MVLWFCEDMARSSSSSAPVFFSFLTRLFTAFSHHLSSVSEPFLHPSRRLTTGGVNIPLITERHKYEPSIGRLVRRCRVSAIYAKKNMQSYCFSTAILFFDKRMLIVSSCGAINDVMSARGLVLRNAWSRKGRTSLVGACACANRSVRKHGLRVVFENTCLKTPIVKLIMIDKCRVRPLHFIL